jgi:hypothetical protein
LEGANQHFSWQQIAAAMSCWASPYKQTMPVVRRFKSTTLVGGVIKTPSKRVAFLLRTFGSFRGHYLPNCQRSSAIFLDKCALPTLVRGGKN